MMIDFSGTVIQSCQDAFAQPVIYLPASGGSYAVRGIFREAYTAIEIVDGAPVSTTKPLLGIRLAEWPSVPQPGEQVEIVGTRTVYVINNTNPDGMGGLRLLLNWVSG